MIRGKTLRGTAAALVAVFVMALAAPASAADSLLLSLLLPGLGQAQDGHYAKASIFGSAALISWVGLFATQVNYSSSVTRYENEKRTYLAYQDQLDRGEVVFIGDIQATYDNMTSAFDRAEDEEKTRNLFIGALAVTYALNIVDILLTGEDTGEVEREPNVSVEYRRDELRLVRTIRF